MNILKKKTPKELNGETPVWFKLWHSEYFLPVDSRSKRTEKWVIAVILGIIAAYFAGAKFALEAMVFVRSLVGQ